jgi:hypothetical protein
MNSQINLPATVRRTLLIAALVICPFLAINSSNAQSTATATLLSGGSNSISIGANQSFQLTLSVTTNFVSSGYTVFYQTSPNGSGLFRITARQNLSPVHPVTGINVFNDPTTADGTAFGGNAGLLDPVNDFDLGYTGDQTNNQAAGSFTLQRITITALNVPVGTYTIFLDRGVMTDRTGGGFNDVPMMASITINIPEPTTVGLAVVGGGALLIGEWRKRRARA